MGSSQRKGERSKGRARISDQRALPTQVLPRKSREMYSRFLESDYPEALVLAEQALQEDPADAIAQAIYSECCKQLRQHDTLPAPKSDRPSEAPTAIVDATLASAALGYDDTPTLDSSRSESSREMYRRFLESDYPQALSLAEERLADAPEDPMALAIAHESRAAIELRASIPVVKSELGTDHPLGAREALIFARVDGVATVGEITDGSGLPPAEALHLIEQLFQAGVLELRNP